MATKISAIFGDSRAGFVIASMDHRDVQFRGDWPAAWEAERERERQADTISGVLPCYDNFTSLLPLVLPIAGIAYRCQIEERALIAGLGDPYRTCIRRTKRLIPFVL
jgi:hypothetical protein